MIEQLTIFDRLNIVADKSIKAISIRQPWASLIALGLKQYETRRWRTNYRGKLVICSTQKYIEREKQYYSSFADKYQIAVSWENLPVGCAIAICELTDCIEMTEDLINVTPSIEIDCGNWNIGTYAWKLDKARALDNPIAVQGQQGLWDIDPTIFDAVSDIDHASLTDPVSERKRQAMSRFLAKAKDNEACVNKYSPGGRKKEYFRLSVRQKKEIGKKNGKVKHFHIRGGNVNSRLAKYRANQLQQMIDRGAELGEIIAAVEDYGSQN